MKRAWVIGAMLWTVGCRLDPACDPGQRYELGSCVPKPIAPTDASQDEDSGSTGTSDAQAADAASECKPGPGHYEGFGRTCQSDRDCTSCVAPTCATSPINRCSRINCQDDPQACPPGWSCTDISAFSMTPSVTHICLE